MRATTTKSKAPHYPNLYKNLQEKHVALQGTYHDSLKKIVELDKKLLHRRREDESLHSIMRDKDRALERFKSENQSYQRMLSDLGAEINDLEEFAKLWRACSIALVAALIVAAVMVGGIK